MATEVDNNNSTTTEGEVESKQMGDKYIWGIFIALCLISIVEAYSASSREVLSAGIYAPLVKHTIMLVVGGLIVYFMQRIPYYKYIKPIPVFGLVTFLLLGLTLLFDAVNDAQRAVPLLGGFTVQPSEMAKFGIALLIAWTTAKNQKPDGVKNTGIFICAAIIAAFGGLMVGQGLSNTILLMSISVALLLIAGIGWMQLIKLFVFYVVLGILLLGVSLAIDSITPQKSDSSKNTETTAMVADVAAPDVAAQGKSADKEEKVSSIKKFFRRIETWRNRVDRYSDDTPLYKQPRTKENAQEHFARMAQANSKVIGTGPGNSRECSRLPLAYIDYVYSIIVEELGYAGGIVVLVLYLWLFARAGSIAWRCKRTFPALLVMGMAVFIVFQALFHICINVGVMPVSGQPLPLISKGGTSILITCMAFGIMLSVSRTAVQSNKSKEVKEEIEQLPTDLQGSNLSQK